MKYYKVTLTNGDTLAYESKSSLSDENLLDAMIEEALLSPVDRDEVTDIEPISEEEYEEYSF
jgi:hypothetical protein